jgi:hypothetical protein
MKDIVIVRFQDGEDVYYELHDERGTYLADATDLDDAVQQALDLAREHDLQHVTLWVETQTP